MASILHAEWEAAPSPNYANNRDLEVSSTLREYGCCMENKLNRSNIRSDVLDFWGEGRSVSNGVWTGFRSCYNANHQYQLVSPGASDAGRKIPNRIPTLSYTDSNIGLYVARDTFRVVTLMGAPIVACTAKEMTRVVQKDKGVIVLYGTVLETDLNKLEKEATKIGFVHDALSSRLVGTIKGLQEIRISGHPEHTRVYHKNRPIVSSTKRRSLWLPSNCEPGECGKGPSEFSAEGSQVLVGCKHDGREDGKIWYKTGRVFLSNGIVSACCSTRLDDSGWISVGQGSGKEKDGCSEYICPSGSVLVSGRHVGDENEFRYGWLSLEGQRCETYDVSGWKTADRESNSEFECPDSCCLVGVKHKGDKDGETWYKCAKVCLAWPHPT